MIAKNLNVSVSSRQSELKFNGEEELECPDFMGGKTERMKRALWR